MLEKDPHLRPDSISEVLACIRSYLAGGFEVEFDSSEIVSVDESSVPGTMVLGREDSEDLLCLISDYLEGVSDDDSGLNLVVHNDILPPAFPEDEEMEVTETNLTGKVLTFEIEESESMDQESVDTGFTTKPTEGGLSFSLAGDWEEENTEDISEVELNPQPLSVVVGVVPYQAVDLHLPPEQGAAQINDDDFLIEPAEEDGQLNDIAEAARMDIADAVVGISEEQHELIALPGHEEETKQPKIESLNSEDILIHEAAMIADQSISEDEMVISVVPVFEDASEEDTLFPNGDEGEEVLHTHATPVLILPSDIEITEPLIEHSPSINLEVTEKITDRPFVAVSVEFEDEITTKLDKSLIHTHKNNPFIFEMFPWLSWCQTWSLVLWRSMSFCLRPIYSFRNHWSDWVIFWQF